MVSLTHGRPIVKTLPAAMGREMNTAGGVRIQSAAMARFVNQFKTLEGFKTSQFIKQIQKFSDPPKLSDLDPLVLEQEDLDALRTCQVGECDVQLAAGDIKRFNAEVNWRSPDAVRAATALYKAVLFAHLDKYRAGGMDQLLAYQDREATVKLARGRRTSSATPSILEHAPAFRHHIRRYPSGAGANMENFFYWSKETFGFKPVVGLNHVSVYTDADTGNVLIATTQIYASHYLDGSLGIHALLPDSMSAAEPRLLLALHEPHAHRPSRRPARHDRPPHRPAPRPRRADEIDAADQTALRSDALIPCGPSSPGPRSRPFSILLREA